jgi:CHAD domain-containing protein
LQALQLDAKRKGRRVLRAITPMRKKAGSVRDMDVLTAFASGLSIDDGERQCLVKLLEHLGEKRSRSAGRLRKSVAKRRKKARERLKVCSSTIEKTFDKAGAARQKEWPIDAAAAALRVSGELSKWPKLSVENLHPFRLKVKELRYMLQLSGRDGEVTARLGEVKDQIGEWHDWTELQTIAKELLSDCRNCQVVARIGETTKKKLQAALRDAQRLRREYFESPTATSKQKRENVAVKTPVLKATATLAA